MRKIIGICLIIFVLLFLMSSFSLAKDEIEGYKGVGWGTSFDEFRTLKDYNGEYGEEDNTFRDDKSDNNNIAVCIGVPIYTGNIGGFKFYEVQLNYLPQKFSTVYIDSDDVYYIFYEGNFVMAYTEVQTQNYQTYFSQISKKYKKISNFNKKITCLENTPNDLSATIFQKGNTIVYLMKSKTTSIEMGMAWIHTSILYASKNFIDNIKKEIKKSVDLEKSKELKKQKEADKEDMQKIE